MPVLPSPAIPKGYQFMSLYETDQYLKNNPGWHEEDSPWKVERILEMVRKHGL